jgi:hypothetical protein
MREWMRRSTPREKAPQPVVLYSDPIKKGILMGHGTFMEIFHYFNVKSS